VWLFLIHLAADPIHELLNSLIACALIVYVKNDARCTREIKFRIAMAKAAFSEKKALFNSRLHLNLRKKLEKCNIWNIALCGGETWTFQKVGQKYIESFEMWCWRRMERSDGLMVWKVEKYYTESRGKGMCCVQ
jgi:hypothetical protein